MVAPSDGYLSINEFASDGSKTEYDLSFAGGYLSRDDISMYVYGEAGEVALGYTFTWLGDYQVSLSSAPPKGFLVRFGRNSPYTSPIHNFSDGSLITEGSLDQNANQAIFLAAELRDRFGSNADLAAIPQAVAQAEAAAALAEATIEDMGVFSGSTIPDNVTLHSAMQALESRIEHVVNFADKGVVVNDISAGVANVTAMREAIAVISARGGGRLTGPSGTITLDGTALGSTGLVLPSNIVLDPEPGCVLVSTTPTSGNLLTASGASNVVVTRNVELRGLVNFLNVSKGRFDAKVTGALSTTVQYSETGINVASYFGTAGQRYSDGTGTSDLTTNTTPYSSATFSYASPVMTSTLPATGLGTDTFASFAVSDYIPLNAAWKYVIKFDNGFLAGAAAATPKIVCYDASYNPVFLNSTAQPNNDYQPQAAWDLNTIASAIRGAAYIRIAVGVRRDYSTPVSLAALWDMSKITIYRVVNDYETKLTAVIAGGSSPGDSPQAYFNACTSYEIAGYWSMIDRGSIKLNACSKCIVDRPVMRNVLQGIVDDGGDGNSIISPNIDMRMTTTGGASMGSRVFRLRGIGGQSSDGVFISNPKIRGASWAIEMLAQSISRKATIIGGDIEAEYAGVSMARVTWFGNGINVKLANDGRHGFECPGGDDGTGLGNGLQDATLVGCRAVWPSFVGYHGDGVSMTDGSRVRLKECTFIAPYMVQNISPNSDGVLEIDGMSGQYAISAILGRTGPIYARINKCRPAPIHMSGWARSGMVDAQTTITADAISLVMEDCTVGYGPLANVNNYAKAAISAPRVQTPQATYVPDRYIRVTPPSTGTLNVDLSNVSFLNYPSSVPTAYWANIVSAIGTITGSTITVNSATVNGERAACPGGTYSRTILRGAPYIGTYALSGQVVGTIAAGATWTSPSFTVTGAAVVTTKLDVICKTPGALAGLTVYTYPTADDAGLLKLTNGTSSDIAVGTVDFIITGNLNL